MSTTALAIASERAGQVVLIAAAPAMDSAIDGAETFTLPSGFGDCFIMGTSFTVSSIQTAVANGDMRGPSVLVNSAGVVKDFVETANWKRAGALFVISAHECRRPVLWQANEVISVFYASEDTGAGDTSLMSIRVRVSRLRNQTSLGSQRFMYPQG